MYEWSREFFKTIKREGVEYELLANTPVNGGWNAAVYVQQDRRVGTVRRDDPVLVCIVDRANRSHEEGRDVEGAIDWLLSKMLFGEWRSMESNRLIVDRVMDSKQDLGERMRSGPSRAARHVRDAAEAAATLIDAAEMLHGMSVEDNGKLLLSVTR